MVSAAAVSALGVVFSVVLSACLCASKKIGYPLTLFASHAVENEMARTSDTITPHSAAFRVLGDTVRIRETSRHATNVARLPRETVASVRGERCMNHRGTAIIKAKQHNML